MRPYPLTPQVMNGTGALRQFVPRVARHSSRATFGYWPAPVITMRYAEIFKDFVGTGLP
jgi:hypothetical protein